jgi:hypothetical protein
MAMASLIGPLLSDWIFLISASVCGMSKRIWEAVLAMVVIS